MRYVRYRLNYRNICYDKTMPKKEIEQSFNDSLKVSTLADASIDIAESSIDFLLNDELIKQIPIVKILLGVAQTGITIQDKLLLKKVISFLNNINEVNMKDRKSEIEKIDNSKKYRLKVGEKLLYIINSCDDHEVAERIAKLFSAFLKHEISYDEYLEASSILTRLSDSDLDLFLSSYNVSSMSDDTNQLIYTGLVYSEIDQVEVEVTKSEPGDWDDPQDRYDTDVSGGEIRFFSTDTGDVIYEVFGIGKAARLKQLAEENELRRIEHEKYLNERRKKTQTDQDAQTRLV